MGWRKPDPGESCRATNRRGKQCENWPTPGATVCRNHGGAAPQVKEKAAQRVAMAKAQTVVGRLKITPTDDAVSELQRIAGETVALKDYLRKQVQALTQIRYRAETEQTRAELVCYMASLRDCERILTSLARLGLEERNVRIKESQATMVRTAVERALRAAGLEGAALERGRKAVGQHLRVLSGGKGGKAA